MKAKSLLALLLLLALLTLSACSNDDAPSSSAALPPQSETTTPSQQAPIVDPPDEAFSVIPVTLVDDDSLLGAAYWIDDTTLLTTFSKSEIVDYSPPAETSVILYNTENQSERLIATLNTDGVGAIRSDEQIIMFTTLETIYVLSKSDFSVQQEFDNIGSGWGSTTFGGLTAVRDDDGIVIRHSDGTQPDIRVATRTNDYLFDGSVWSFDGKYLAFGKYTGSVGDPVNICIADRNGNMFWEIEIPESDYDSYWSSNSRYFITTVQNELGDMVRVFDTQAEEQIAAVPSPYSDDSYDVRDIYETSIFCWRKRDFENKLYTICSFDALTGHSTDYAVVDEACDIKVSRDGKQFAVIDRVGGGEIKLFQT